MNDKSKVLWSVLLGGAAGGVLGYYYLTVEGARRRVDLEPRLRELVSEVQRLRVTVADAILAAREGWDLVAGLAARDGGPQPGGRQRASETLH